MFCINAHFLWMADWKSIAPNGIIFKKSSFLPKFTHGKDWNSQHLYVHSTIISEAEVQSQRELWDDSWAQHIFAGSFAVYAIIARKRKRSGRRSAAPHWMSSQPLILHLQFLRSKMDKPSPPVCSFLSFFFFLFAFPIIICRFAFLYEKWKLATNGESLLLFSCIYMQIRLYMMLYGKYRIQYYFDTCLLL